MDDPEDLDDFEDEIEAHGVDPESAPRRRKFIWLLKQEILSLIRYHGSDDPPDDLQKARRIMDLLIELVNAQYRDQ